ncbi:DUF3800 domain-containing protein [Methylorubrum sp. Q1]|uniref:DUF3800 domain-containing protein n=1 Tax=Methylorubrum sp. Q1 TaxID=2562453 RepID=UPI001076778D|nr:DUF3800 domain-containing protein [Methylorubrum sp. Q1]TFZ56057.1 DUF3800 domain-containing protein [Methylorubrum sp. Q1]
MPRVAPEPSQISNIYVDESSQTKHKYLVLGGIILPSESCDGLAESIWAARQPELPKGEMKWVKVSRSKLDAYLRVVDTFFDRKDINRFEFHSLIVDTHKLNDRKYNQGCRDTGFNKEIYQLLMKFRRLHSGCLFHVYPDRRSTKNAPEDLRVIVNRGALKSGDRRDYPFRRIHFRDSDAEVALQLVDLLIGAIAYRLNGHDQAPDASQAKRSLCEHVLARAGIKDVMRDTAASGRFTIWHRRLR